MKKIEAIIRHERLQDVQDALDQLGVSGPHRERGGGLRPPEGLHRAVPRRAGEHLAAAEDQGGVRGAVRTSSTRRSRRSSPRPARERSATGACSSTPSSSRSASAPASAARTASATRSPSAGATDAAGQRRTYGKRGSPVAAPAFCPGPGVGTATAFTRKR